MLPGTAVGSGKKAPTEATSTSEKEPSPSQYGDNAYPPQPPPGAYGAPPPYGQPAGMPPPVYTCPTPAQPYYPEQQAGPAYYTSAPPPAAYPYQEQEVPVKPSVVGKPDNLAEDLEGNAAYTDASASEDKITPDIDISIRHAFVRKVYCILAIQILLTFGLAIAFSLSITMAKWLVNNWWLSLVGMIVSLICILLVSCVQSLGRRFPINFILLTIITLGMASCVCMGAATTNSYSFFFACGITSAVVIALTIFAIQVKYDFTGWGPLVLASLLVLFLSGILCIFFRSRISSCLYAGLSALVFSFILVYDTQLIVGGKHRKYQYSVDDYVFGALTLYLDVVSLFVEVLTLLQHT